MGASRESTKQEIIVNSIVHSVRNLDKLTWSFYDKVKMNGGDLIEEAEYIISKCNEYIQEIRNLQSRKD